VSILSRQNFLIEFFLSQNSFSNFDSKPFIRPSQFRYKINNFFNFLPNTMNNQPKPKQGNPSKYKHFQDETEEEDPSFDLHLNQNQQISGKTDKSHLESKFFINYKYWILLSIGFNLFSMLSDFVDFFQYKSIILILIHIVICAWDILQLSWIYQAITKKDPNKINKVLKSIKYFIIIYVLWSFISSLHSHNDIIAAFEYSFRRALTRSLPRSDSLFYIPNGPDFHCYSYICFGFVSTIYTLGAFILYYYAYLYGARKVGEILNTKTHSGYHTTPKTNA